MNRKLVIGGVLTALLALPAGAAQDGDAGPAGGDAPTVSWLVDFGPVGGQTTVRPYGVYLTPDGGLSTTRLDPATGEAAGTSDLACLGPGPANLDIGVRYATDDGGALTGVEVLHIDQHTGALATDPALVLPAPDRPFPRAEGCTVSDGYGDLTLVTTTVSSPADLVPTTSADGLRATATTTEALWRTFHSFCPSVAVGNSGRAPELNGRLVVETGSDCDQRYLRAFELRDHEVLPELPIGSAFAHSVPPQLTALGAALVTGSDGAVLYDLLPGPSGLEWTARWRLDEPVCDACGPVVGEELLLIDGGDELIVVDQSTGDVAYRLPQTDETDPGVFDGLDRLVQIRGDALRLHDANGTEVWTVPGLRAALGVATGSGETTVTVEAVQDDGGIILSGTQRGDTFVARMGEAGAPNMPSGARRIADGDDPIDMAVQTCRRVAPTFQSADRVLIARHDVFADALAGAALAGPNGCILYVDGGPDAGLDWRTLYEIARVIPGGGRVYVLGGTNAVSSGVETAVRNTGWDVVRLAGASRVETAALIAREVATLPGFVALDQPTAYLATAGNFPDAITAGAHAAFAGVPVLLTDSGSLSAPASDALRDLGITRTVLLGGEAALSAAVEAAVPGPERVAGSTRFGTAAEVARGLWAPGDVTGALLVTIHDDDSWQAALAAAPLSARYGAPQIGVASNLAPAEAIQAFADVVPPPGRVTVIGTATRLHPGTVAAVAGGSG